MTKPFQFGLGSLFVLTAGVGIIVWTGLSEAFWSAVPTLVQFWPLGVFCAWVFWLRRQSKNS